MLGRDIDRGNPVSDHPLNYGLTGWWLPLPNNQGGYTLFSLASRWHAALTTTVAWRPGAHVAHPAIEYSGGALTAKATCTGLDLPATFTICNYFLGYSYSSGRTIWSQGGTNYLRLFFDTSGATVTGTDIGSQLGMTSGLSTYRWYHVAIVREGSSTTDGYKGYLDGVHKGSANSGTWSGSFSDNLVLGSRNSFGDSLDGKMMSASLYNRALSASEIWRLSQEAHQGFPNMLRRIQRRSWFVEAPAAAGSVARRPLRQSRNASLVRR